MGFSLESFCFQKDAIQGPEEFRHMAFLYPQHSIQILRAPFLAKRQGCLYELRFRRLCCLGFPGSGVSVWGFGLEGLESFMERCLSESYTYSIAVLLMVA